MPSVVFFFPLQEMPLTLTSSGTFPTWHPTIPKNSTGVAFISILLTDSFRLRMVTLKESPKGRGILCDKTHTKTKGGQFVKSWVYPRGDVSTHPPKRIPVSTHLPPGGFFSPLSPRFSEQYGASLQIHLLATEMDQHFWFFYGFPPC